MSRDRDLDLDAILAEFHGREEKAAPVNRPAAPKTPSRRELREEAERQAAAQKPAPTGDKTVLFEKLPAESPAPQPKAAVKAPAPAGEELPAEEPRKKTPAAPVRKAAEGPAKAPARKQAKKEQRPGTAFALMALVLLVLAAALAGLMRWSSLAEEAAKPQPPEEIRLSLGEDLEALLNEEAASSR